MKRLSIWVIALILASGSAAMAMEATSVCNAFEPMWEDWAYWADDDPKVVKAAETGQMICRDLLRKRISDDEALALLKEPLKIIAPVAAEMDRAGFPRQFWHAMTYETSKLVGQEAAPYWVLWSVSLLPLLILLAVSHFWDALETPTIVLLSAHFIAFLMLLAGGFVPLLKVIGLILGIIASTIGIVAGIKSIASPKKT